MISPSDIAAIGRCLSNRLDGSVFHGNAIAGVIGDSPSQYSKSPRLWNAAFRHLQMNAVYVPFDVEDARIGDLLSALRHCEDFVGVNVTVPYKIRVMDLLDSIDDDARRIQAVNTIVRTADGKLIGYNTDGEGFIDSIRTRQPDRAESFLPCLEGMTVLLLGAGGSARAVAFHLADHLTAGRLIVCNRTATLSSSLTAEIQKHGRDAIAISEEELPLWAPRAGLIVNCTTKGQGGRRRLPNGMATFLEPYSALSPAHPPQFAASEIDQPNFERRWSEAAGKDIQSNHQASIQLAATIPSHVGFYDLIYHPEETVFLRHGKSTGHPTMNGKAMIVNQAVIAFCQRICRFELRRRQIDTPETRDEILQIMYRAW